MAEANKKQKPRKKRQQEVLSQELISKVENKFSSVVEEAIILRNSIF